MPPSRKDALSYKPPGIPDGCPLTHVWPSCNVCLLLPLTRPDSMHHLTNIAIQYKGSSPCWWLFNLVLKPWQLTGPGAPVPSKPQPGHAGRCTPQAGLLASAA